MSEPHTQGCTNYSNLSSDFHIHNIGMRAHIHTLLEWFFFFFSNVGEIKMTKNTCQIGSGPLSLLIRKENMVHFPSKILGLSIHSQLTQIPSLDGVYT